MTTKNELVKKLVEIKMLEKLLIKKIAEECILELEVVQSELNRRKAILN